MAGLRVLSQGAIIVLGGGGSQPILPPVLPDGGLDQSAVDRALGLPQIYKMIVAYHGVLKPEMGVRANELDQQTFP